MPWWTQEPQRPAAGGLVQGWKDHLGALTNSKVRVIVLAMTPLK